MNNALRIGTAGPSSRASGGTERSTPPNEAARTSLLGLAVGDAYGTMLDGYGPELARRAVKRLISMKRPWGWTDDTVMAISIVELLLERGTIDPDALAAAFVRRSRGRWHSKAGEGEVTDCVPRSQRAKSNVTLFEPRFAVAMSSLLSPL